MTNGASELMGEVFGAPGAHARSAFGVAQIPLGACVEIELIAELADKAPDLQSGPRHQTDWPATRLNCSALTLSGANSARGRRTRSLCHARMRHHQGGAANAGVTKQQQVQIQRARGVEKGAHALLATQYAAKLPAVAGPSNGFGPAPRRSHSPARWNPPANCRTATSAV